LARPGGNASGFTALEYSFASKWLELMKEIAPRITRDWNGCGLAILAERQRHAANNPAGPVPTIKTRLFLSQQLVVLSGGNVAVAIIIL
jgi:hypothetical protein